MFAQNAERTPGRESMPIRASVEKKRTFTYFNKAKTETGGVLGVRNPAYFSPLVLPS